MIQMLVRPTTLVVLVLAVGPGACSREDLEVSNDGDPALEGDGGDSGLGADADSRGGDHLAVGAPMSLVLADLEVRTQRVCDVDGDGVLDNSIANMGEPAASMFAAIVRGLLGTAVQEGRGRTVVHVPWVDDPSVPAGEDISFVMLAAIEPSTPDDPSDDFTGDASFQFRSNSADACGEPLHVASEATLVGGVLAVRGDAVPFGSYDIVRDARIDGTIAPEGAQASLQLCGVMAPARLAAVAGPTFGRGRTLLEAVVAPSEATGIAGLPGLELDVDLDGDGLEGFVVDDEGLLSSCVDGDRTVIDGRDCWRDPRMADAFSVTFGLEAVGGRLVGPEPGTWRELWRSCEEGLPPDSAWGPCPLPAEAACRRNEARECVAACGVAGMQACEWDCSGWPRCWPGSVASVDASSCDEVEATGAARCDPHGEGSTVSLVSGPDEAGALRLVDPVVVGAGSVVITAELHVARATSEEPGEGWAIAVYLDDSGRWPGEIGRSWHPLADLPVGADADGRGYSVEWRHRGLEASDRSGDSVTVMALDGSGEPSLLCSAGCPWDGECEQACTEDASPDLDAGTEGVVAQKLRLELVPDDPATEEDETAVVASRFVGDEPVRLLVGCSDGSCPVRAQPGDVATVGVVAATSSLRDATASMELPVGLSVDIEGPCVE